MLQRLYIHNFGCLQNFEIKPEDNNSLLLIGKNGTGKSTIAKVLLLFQKLGSGISRISSIVTKDDFTLGRVHEQMVFELQVLLEGKTFFYQLVLDFPENFKELRVVEENLSFDDQNLYIRQEAQVTYPSNGHVFSLDWHTIALSVFSGNKENPVVILQKWMRDILVLAPVPQLMLGEAHDSFEPLVPSCKNFATYMTRLLRDRPSAYGTIYSYLKKLTPDLQEFQTHPLSSEVRLINVVFGDSNSNINLKFDRLSDGEKCMFLCAVILAVQKYSDNILVFWDEPDNYLALSEVEYFISLLRQKFQNDSQIWMTSHNEETINCFSHENTFLLQHKNHLSPIEIHSIEKIIDSKESIVQKFRLNELE